MRVLMIARHTLYTVPGGDTTQISMTANYLRKMSVLVDIRLSNEAINYSDYDIIHYFNIIRPIDIIPHIKASKKPFVISPIFVDYLEFEKKHRRGVFGILGKILLRDQIEYLKTIARGLNRGGKIPSFFYIKAGQRKSIKYIAEQSSLLLPNSKSEYIRLSNTYNLQRPYSKVVNAVDTEVFNITVNGDINFQNHVICVGRIEGLKNQLNLIKALANTDFNLTIIGKSAPNHKQYYLDCVKLASNTRNVKIISHIDHKELASIYKTAKVHVLPSWFETTGLSSLEAGAMGCNLVITKKGDTEEYFGDMAYYCDPDDVASIKEAVIKAFNAPSNSKLQEYILNNYTWQHTAEQTLKAYQSVLLN